MPRSSNITQRNNTIKRNRTIKRKNTRRRARTRQRQRQRQRNIHRGGSVSQNILNKLITGDTNYTENEVIVLSSMVKNGAKLRSIGLSDFMYRQKVKTNVTNSAQEVLLVIEKQFTPENMSMATDLLTGVKNVLPSENKKLSFLIELLKLQPRFGTEFGQHQERTGTVSPATINTIKQGQQFRDRVAKLYTVAHGEAATDEQLDLYLDVWHAFYFKDDIKHRVLTLLLLGIKYVSDPGAVGASASSQPIETDKTMITKMMTMYGDSYGLSGQAELMLREMNELFAEEFSARGTGFRGGSLAEVAEAVAEAVAKFWLFLFCAIFVGIFIVFLAGVLASAGTAVAAAGSVLVPAAAAAVGTGAAVSAIRRERFKGNDGYRKDQVVFFQDKIKVIEDRIQQLQSSREMDKAKIHLAAMRKQLDHAENEVKAGHFLGAPAS
jgi:hypothetical protein